MKLVLGGINAKDPYVSTLPDDANIHQFVNNLNSDGLRPVVYSIIPLPLVGSEVFVSARVIAGNQLADITLSFNLGDGKLIKISDVGSYLNFFEFLCLRLASQRGLDIRFLFSISLF